MLMGQAIYQDKCPSSGNNWVQYQFVMWRSPEENGSDNNTIWANTLGTELLQTFELRSENTPQYFYPEVL